MNNNKLFVFLFSLASYIGTVTLLCARLNNESREDNTATALPTHPNSTLSLQPINHSQEEKIWFYSIYKMKNGKYAEIGEIFANNIDRTYYPSTKRIY